MAIKDTDVVTVCDKCFQASCWHGEILCWESQNAGTVEMTVTELREKATGEHEAYWDICENFGVSKGSCLSHYPNGCMESLNRKNAKRYPKRPPEVCMCLEERDGSPKGSS